MINLENHYVQIVASGLEISQNRHLPCITKFFGIYGEIINLHWKSSKVSLALQPGALVNTGGRVDFSSPEPQIWLVDTGW